jgi:hypothetical protein
MARTEGYEAGVRFWKICGALAFRSNSVRRVGFAFGLVEVLYHIAAAHPGQFWRPKSGREEESKLGRRALIDPRPT